MLKIGLTGGIGSGKTAVSELFNRTGIPVIDTDVISRDLVQNNQAVIEDVMTTFGNDVLDGNAVIDRKNLAQLVFNNKENKQQLEKILHPRIRHEVNRQINEFETSDHPPSYLIVVIPLLFETGFNIPIDQTLVVVAEKAVRIERVKQRDNRSLDEINLIINSQVSDEKRISEADDIIENNSDFRQLELQVEQLHNKYRNSQQQ